VSTQINVTVDSGGLSDKARQLQTAARQAQLEKERQQRIEVQGQEQRTANLAAAGRAPDGTPLFGPGFRQPEIERRPAASRFGQGLNLGHLWLFADNLNTNFSTGITEIAGQFGRSRTSTGIRGALQNVLVGSGTGNSWVTFEGLGTEGAPPLPADTFNVSYITEVPFSPIIYPQSTDYERRHVGTRKSGRTVTRGFQQRYFALPCGRGNFIFIHGFSSVWDTLETDAYYAARGLYSKDDGSFIAFFDYTTSSFTSTTIPDDLDGFTGFIDGVLVPNFGVVGAQGYTGKNRKFTAYSCNNTTIREISIPATLASIIDLAYPEPILTERTVIVRNGTSVSLTYPIYVLSSGEMPIYGEQGYSNNYYGLVYTPAVFERINNISSFVDPGAIKPYPTELKWGLSDNSEGAYTRFQDVDTFVNFPYWSNMYREGAPFYHSLWPNKNEEPDLSIWDPDYAPVWENTPKPKRVNRATLNLSPSRAPRNGATDRTFSPGSYWSEDFVTVWDWDDPAYCGAMCKALGFTDADLTP